MGGHGALRYQSEGPGIDPRSLGIFSGASDSSVCPGVDSVSKNEYQEYPGKDGWCVRVTTLPPSCDECLEILEPQPTRNLKGHQACSGITLPLPFYIKIISTGQRVTSHIRFKHPWSSWTFLTAYCKKMQKPYSIFLFQTVMNRNCNRQVLLFSVAKQPNSGKGRLIAEAGLSQTFRHKQPARSLRTSDQSVAWIAAYTTHNTHTHTKQTNIHALSGIRPAVAVIK